MVDKPNGKDNSSGKVTKFPTLAERDRIRKKQEKQENAWRKAYRSQNSEPFFNFGNIPPFTLFISATYLIIHLITTLFVGDIARFGVINQWGFVAADFTNSGGFDLFKLLTPMTYNFFHGDWTHLGFNVIMGLALGTFVEKMFSTITLIKYYFICGIGAILLYFILNVTAETPVIGASGAISGLFAAALLMMYEQGRFGSFAGKWAHKGPWPMIAIWALIMSLIGISFGGIAWEAHLGGFLTGAGLYHFMRKGKLRL